MVVSQIAVWPCGPVGGTPRPWWAPRIAVSGLRACREPLSVRPPLCSRGRSIRPRPCSGWSRIRLSRCRRRCISVPRNGVGRPGRRPPWARRETPPEACGIWQQRTPASVSSPAAGPLRACRARLRGPACIASRWSLWPFGVRRGRRCPRTASADACAAAPEDLAKNRRADADRAGTAGQRGR